MLRGMVFCLALLGAGVARADVRHDCYYAEDVARKHRACAALIRRNPNDEYAYNNRGIAYEDEGDYDAAIADYTKAIQIDPKYADAYYNRGNVYSKQKGDYDAAIADYNKAIRIDPKSPKSADVYSNRGTTYENKGDHDAAITDFNKAIQIKPDDAVAYNNRGNAYDEKGDHDAAIADYNKAIQIKPDYAEAYYNRGIAYADKGDYDAAISDYTKAIKIEPNDAANFNNRGIAYKTKGDHDAAIADFNKAIQIKPDDAVAYNNRGNAYERKGDYDAAIADYNKAIQIKPDYAKAYYNRGIAYKKKGDYDAAIADYNKAIQIKPDDADAYYYRGRAYHKKQEYTRAIEDYTKATEINPKDAYNFSGRAWTYFKAGQAARGFPDAERALELKPNEPDFLDTRGEIFEALGRRDEAVADFRRAIDEYTKAIEIDPKNAYNFNGRAWVYFKAGQAAKGLPDAERALELKPNEPDFLGTRGNIFEALGRRDEAIADLRRALSINPEDPDLQPSRDALKRLEGSPTAPSPSPGAGAGPAPANIIEACTKEPNNDAAITACSRLIDSGNVTGGELATAYEARGLAYRDKQEYDRAIADFDKAIELAPSSASAHYNRGFIYNYKGSAMGKDEIERAIQDFDRALQLDPNHYEALRSRGYMYELKRDYGRAIDDYDRAVNAVASKASGDADLAFKLAWALSSRCRARGMMNQLEAALADCNLALRSDTTWLPQERAAVYLKLGQFDNAVADYDAVLKPLPDNWVSLYGRGLARLKKGDTDAGNVDIAAARAIHPGVADWFMETYGIGETSPTPPPSPGGAAGPASGADVGAAPASADGADFLKRGEAAQRDEHYNEALDAFTRASRAGDLSDTQLATVYYNLGNVRGFLGDNVKAVEDFSKSIELNSKNGSAYSLRGYLRGALGQYDLAEKDHIAALELAKDEKWEDYRPWALQHYADMWRRRGEFTKALEYCAQALHEKEYAVVNFRRAWIYLDMGQTAQAKVAYDKFDEEMKQQNVSYSGFWPDERSALARLRELR